MADGSLGEIDESARGTGKLGAASAGVVRAEQIASLAHRPARRSRRQARPLPRGARAASRQPSKSVRCASATDAVILSVTASGREQLQLRAFGSTSARRSARSVSSGRSPVRGDDERPDLGDRDGSRARSSSRSRRQRRDATMRSTAWTPRPGTRSSMLRRRAVDVDREALAILERPGELGVDVERSMPSRVGRALHLRRREAVEAHQPVGLVEAVLADQRRALQRQHGARVGDRGEGRIIDAAQADSGRRACSPCRRCRGRSQRRRRRSSGSTGPPARMRARTCIASRRRRRRSIATSCRASRLRSVPASFSGASRSRPACGRQLDVDRHAVGMDARPGGPAPDRRPGSSSDGCSRGSRDPRAALRATSTICSIV